MRRVRRRRLLAQYSHQMADKVKSLYYIAGRLKGSEEGSCTVMLVPGGDPLDSKEPAERACSVRHLSRDRCALRGEGETRPTGLGAYIQRPGGGAPRPGKFVACRPRKQGPGLRRSRERGARRAGPSVRRPLGVVLLLEGCVCRLTFASQVESIGFRSDAVDPCCGHCACCDGA